MKFLHLPTSRLIDTDNHSQSHRYRRSSNFLELTEDATKSPQSPTVAPDSPQTPPDDPDTAPPLLQVPDGNVSEVLNWAGQDPARIAAALIAEKNGKQRVTLIRALED